MGSGKGFHVVDLTELYVACEEDIFRLIEVSCYVFVYFPFLTMTCSMETEIDKWQQQI